MDDPVVAASAGSETETIGRGMQNNQNNSADEIVKFFDDIKNRQGIFGDQQKEQVSSELDDIDSAHVRSVGQQYNFDYKPPISFNKQSVYSINDLVSISKQLPEGHVEEIVFTLPKKKFWRLNHKQPEHSTQGKLVGRRGSNKSLNGSGNSKNFASDDNVNLFERKGNKGKYARMVNGKRNSKFGKHEKNGFMEEKDVTVNHDDLQALEEEFEPTGNSMADFETWKAKMKEMERKKKGVPSSEPVSNTKSSVSTTSSSISDFLGLNKFQSDATANQNNLEANETGGKNLDDSEITTTRKELQPESSKGSYSRFSSFFTQSSSSSSLPTMRNTHDNENSTSKNNQSAVTENAPASHNPNVPGGSKLLSFFNKEASTPKELKNQASLSTHDVRKSSTDSSTAPPSNSHGPVPPVPSAVPQLRNQQHKPHLQPHPQSYPQSHPQSHPQPPMMPPQPFSAQPPPMAPEQLQTNNAFFQNLLNKNELQNSKRNTPPGPPPGVMLPPAEQRSIPLGQQPPPGVHAPNGMSRPPFPMGIPFGGFPRGPPPAGPPPGTGSPAMPPIGSGVPPMIKETNGEDSKGRRSIPGVGGNERNINISENGNGLQQNQPAAPPLQPGMVPPGFIPGMAPPGFPMMPPNFNPMYGPPQGGLMPPPPGGQGFFSPMPPPPSGNMNFNRFPLQPPAPNNQQEVKSAEFKK